MSSRRAAFDEAVSHHRLVAVLRGVDGPGFAGMVEALLDSGVRIIEVACSTPESLDQLAQLCRLAKGRAHVGAGTVLETGLAQAALEAGVEFLVTPHVAPDVIDFALRNDLGILCGAFTPTEIAQARAAGVRFIKLFPASTVGPDYVRALLGPYPDLELLVVGGIGSKNLAPYLEAGALGAGVGGSLTRLDAGDPSFGAVRREAKAVLEILSPR